MYLLHNSVKTEPVLIMFHCTKPEKYHTIRFKVYKFIYLICNVQDQELLRIEKLNSHFQQ